MSRDLVGNAFDSAWHVSCSGSTSVGRVVGRHSRQKRRPALACNRVCDPVEELRTFRGQVCVAEPVKDRIIKVKDVPLESIDEWPPELVAKLKQLWITSAEQVVAAGATPSGISALAEHLSISEDQATRLIAAARSRLSPEVAAEMETPVDTSEYSLGALKPLRGLRKPDE